MLIIFVALMVWLFAGAAYFWLVFPGAIGRSAGIGFVASVIAASLAGLLYFFAIPVHGCSTDWDALNRMNFEGAIDKLSNCLAVPRLEKGTRVHALKARAFAYYKAKEHAAAVGDLEAAFKLEPATNAEDLRQYAIYLRLAGKSQESLDAATQAQQIGDTKAIAGLEYQKAMTLVQLGRHEEAVTAFTQVLSVRESSHWAYWGRGLSYEKLGKPELARGDFRKCAELLNARSDLPASIREFLPTLHAKLQEYETQK